MKTDTPKAELVLELTRMRQSATDAVLKRSNQIRDDVTFRMQGAKGVIEDKTNGASSAAKAMFQRFDAFRLQHEKDQRDARGGRDSGL